MPGYTFKHNETGEIIEVDMRPSEYDDWKENNPEYSRYFGAAPALSWGGTRDVISKIPDGFNDILKTVKKSSGRDNTIKTK